MKPQKNNIFFSKILPTFSALFSLVVFAISANVVPAILIRAADEFDINPELLANVIAVQFAGFIVATIFGGIAADRFGMKYVFLTACVFTIAGSGIWFSAKSLQTIYFGSLVMGMGGGTLEGLSSTLLSDLFPTRRKLVLNISQVAYCVGAVSGPFLIGWLLPAGVVSWRLFFAALSSLALVLLVFYALCSIPSTAKAETISYNILIEIIKKWSFICPCLVIFLYVFSETTCVAFMNVYLYKHCQSPEKWAIYSISIFWGTMTVGRILCALIPESFSFQKIIAFLMFISGILLAAQSVVDEWHVSLILFALTGFIFSGTWPLIVGMTATYNPGYSGTVIGVTIATGALGCVFAPPLTGLLFKYFPGALALGMTSIPLFLGAWLVTRMKSYHFHSG